MQLDACTHSEPRCEDEGKCKDRERFKRNCESVQIVSQTPRSVAVRQRDKDFAKDSEAYKRLRAEGLQPKGVDKSALLERSADHNAEVMLGRPITKTELHAVNRNFGAI